MDQINKVSASQDILTTLQEKKNYILFECTVLNLMYYFFLPKLFFFFQHSRKNTFVVTKEIIWTILELKTIVKKIISK